MKYIVVAATWPVDQHPDTQVQSAISTAICRHGSSHRGLQAPSPRQPAGGQPRWVAKVPFFSLISFGYFDDTTWHATSSKNRMKLDAFRGALS